MSFKSKNAWAFPQVSVSASCEKKGHEATMNPYEPTIHQPFSNKQLMNISPWSRDGQLLVVELLMEK